jgi:hypothetical protein
MSVSPSVSNTTHPVAQATQIPTGQLQTAPRSMEGIFLPGFTDLCPSALLPTVHGVLPHSHRTGKGSTPSFARMPREAARTLRASSHPAADCSGYASKDGRLLSLPCGEPEKYGVGHMGVTVELFLCNTLRMYMRCLKMVQNESLTT